MRLLRTAASVSHHLRTSRPLIHGSRSFTDHFLLPSRSFAISQLTASSMAQTSTVVLSKDRQPSVVEIAAKKGWHLRPLFHVIAPWGWMNDPCAPGYDPKSGLYHLFYQWNPEGCDWGNISWGHLTSKNMVEWKHARLTAALEPEHPYDKDGAFTGCFYPTGSHGEEGEMSLIYSSISSLPFTWSEPYPRGSAGLAIAVSKDAGVSWEKHPKNPFMTEEPEAHDVTGFRDPYLAPWATLDKLRPHSGDLLYGIVAGGIWDKGPTAFIYAVDPKNLTDWKYLGPFVDIPQAFRPSTKWMGDAGVNWECTNFMSLKEDKADGEERHFLVYGSEGGKHRTHSWELKPPEGFPPKMTVWCLWMSGTLSMEGDTPKMKYEIGGILDHGCFYAANTLDDPVSNRRIVWGWLPELEDIPLSYAESKGWNGCLAIPREIFNHTIHDIVGTIKSPLSDIPCFSFSKDSSKGTYSAQTLGIRPLSDLSRLRTGAPLTIPDTSLPSSPHSTHKTVATALTSYEISVTIDIKPGCARAGIEIQHSRDFSTTTRIFFQPFTEELVIDRHKSNTDPQINKRDERGPFTLFTHKSNSSTATGAEDIKTEKLKLRVFVDKNVVEVFANDRFSMSTLVYSEESIETDGLSCFADGEAGSATFEDLKAWKMGSIGLEI